MWTNATNGVGIMKYWSENTQELLFFFENDSLPFSKSRDEPDPCVMQGSGILFAGIADTNNESERCAHSGD